MIDKSNAKTWVKVVAWVLALSFALTMIPLLFLPSGSSNSRSASKPKLPQTDTENIATRVDSLVGQGDLAKKNGELFQAISFYEEAYKLDKTSESIKSNLGKAYLALGDQVSATDTTKAKEAYGKYLELLPDSPKADQVKASLKKLE